MFFARPVSLKTEVWDRIDAYLSDYSASHPGFMPNRSAFLEEAAVAFLDAQEAEASGGSTDDGGDEVIVVEEVVVVEAAKPARKGSKKAAKKSSKKSSKKSAKKSRRK